VTRLEIDVESSVKLPVAAPIETSADEGFAVGQQVHIEPASATLVGPRSRLKEIDSLRTAPRKLGTLRNPVTIRLPLEQPIGYGFRVEPDSVSVTVPVFPVKTRVFERMPIQVFNAPAGAETRTRPNFVRVELTGPPDEIDHLDPNSLTLSVDYRQVSSGNRAKVRFDCPPGFRLKSLSADSVAVVSVPNDNSGD
jgi:YbbR domain-containing protein